MTMPPSGYPPPTGAGYQQLGYGYAAGPGAGARYAGFWIRVLAQIIDSIILAIPSVALFFALVDIDLDGSPSSPGFNGSAGFDTGSAVLVTVLTTIISALYYGLLEGSAGGASLGKKVCSLKVVDEATLQPGIGNARSFARYGVGLLFELPGQLVGFLGLLTLVDILPMLGSDKKQTLHDRATRTCVVKA
jgi:uncharacterized RDD family membrane protein YckC